MVCKFHFFSYCLQWQYKQIDFHILDKILFFSIRFSFFAWMVSFLCPYNFHIFSFGIIRTISLDFRIFLHNKRQFQDSTEYIWCIRSNSNNNKFVSTFGIVHVFVWIKYISFNCSRRWYNFNFLRPLAEKQFHQIMPPKKRISKTKVVNFRNKTNHFFSAQYQECPIRKTFSHKFRIVICKPKTKQMHTTK